MNQSKRNIYRESEQLLSACSKVYKDFQISRVRNRAGSLSSCFFFILKLLCEAASSWKDDCLHVYDCWTGGLMKDRDWLFTCEGFYSDYSNECCCGNLTTHLRSQHLSSPSPSCCHLLREAGAPQWAVTEELLCFKLFFWKASWP